MENFKIIDGVKVCKIGKKIELHVNQSFDGAKLQQWRKKNKIELKEFKNS